MQRSLSRTPQPPTPAMRVTPNFARKSDVAVSAAANRSGAHAHAAEWSNPCSSRGRRREPRRISRARRRVLLVPYRCRRGEAGWRPGARYPVWHLLQSEYHTRSGNRHRPLDRLNYPALTTGLVAAARGIGAMAALFLVAPLINRVDNRLIILFGLLLTAVSMWQMSCFSLQMSMAPVVISGLLQGFGLGCTQVPLNIIALSTLPRHILTQGTAIRSLMRNLGGSVGISILVATLAENTQAVHSRLVEGLRPDNPLL